MNSKSVSFFALFFFFVVYFDGIAGQGHGLRTCKANRRKPPSIAGQYVRDTSCPVSPRRGESKDSGLRMLKYLREPSHVVQDVLVLTVASNETDGFKRYLRSVEVYGFFDNLEVLGLGKPWKGGNMQYPGGGYKTNLLKKELKEYKDDKEKIIFFTDSYDVIYLSGLDAIVAKFKSFEARILFSAEEYCWPDKSLAAKYPAVTRGKPYLNSGGFIGYASDLYELLTSQDIDDKEDDQLYYTKLYLDPKLRAKYNIKLDHRSEIFQNLFGAIADVALEFKDHEAYLQNTVYDTVPLIVHGNGRSKLILNSVGNYLASAWNHEDGCLNCWDDSIDLPNDKPETWPPILIAIFIDTPTPFIEDFFQKIYKQIYPKSKIHLFVHNNAPYHEGFVANFVEEHGKEYKSVKQILPGDNIQDSSARNLAMDHCLLKECSGFFVIDSTSHLDNEHTLSLLVEQQRGIVAPMLVRPYETWSNFWGAIADNGYYARSSDYMQIVENERRGLWNVPYITHCYLINATIIRNPATRPSYSNGDLDSDMAFAMANRNNDVFMYVSNRLTFGHLINPDDFNIKLTNPDMYEIFNNKYDWQERYIHENYTAVFHPDNTPIQPCPDVYWFPIVTERFTKELIEIVEAFGQWSDGSNKDSRIEGGYENVPTRDIHMKQVFYEPQWLRLLKDYVRPLQELVFTGYIHDDPRIEGGYENVPTRDIHLNQVELDIAWLTFLNIYVSPLQEIAFPNYYDHPPRSHMNFVVRYKPEEQPSLRPHHDASTYTINIALNRAGIDYEGGGCRFIRYNCSVTDTKPGWMLMHPGRLTHYHEGLTVKKGTRYIMISFVDP